MFLIAGVVLALNWLLASNAWADAFADCTSKTDLDQRISSCSEAILQNAADKRRLAIIYTLRGSAHAQKGEFDWAIADLSKSIEIEPKGPLVHSVYSARGEAYRLKGDLDRAIVDFNAAIAANPREAGAYHSRALVHSARRNGELAIADLSKVLEIDPRNIRALYDRALTYEWLGDKTKALADLRNAQSIAPADRRIQETIVRLSGSSDPRQRQAASELTSLLQRIQTTRDPLQRIALAAQALELEQGLSPWPLQGPREIVKGELWFHIGGSNQSLVVDADGRPLKDASDRLEKAIAAYDRALTFWTRQSNPSGWAYAQGNRALAYSNRRQGNVADNIEKAIAGYQQALTVRTRESLPTEWAQTQHNLGLVYAVRVRGDEGENREKAIAAYQAALIVRTREAHPEQWAATTGSLSAAYRARVLGERADNFERAIAGYEAILTVLTREKYPRRWGDTQDNLGSAYATRIHGDRAQNLEKSLAAYQAALSVRARESDSEAWAQSQVNIGATYNSRLTGDRADNEIKSLAAYQAALTVYTREALPQFWAAIQSNVGHVHLRRKGGDAADNVEKAISHFELAHAVFTPDGSPSHWASQHRNIGDAYRIRIKGDHAVNLAKAVASYEAALTVYTRDGFPNEHLRTAQRLASISIETSDWQKAGTAANSAREAFLLLFGQGLDASGAAGVIEAVGPLFADAAFAASKRGDLDTALKFAAEGRARQMAASLRLQDLDLDATRRRRLDDLRAAIREQSRLYDTTSGLERSATLEKLAGLRRDLLALVQEADKSAVKGTRDTIVVASQLVPPEGAIVVPVVTKVGAAMLVLSSANAGKATVLQLPDFTSGRLETLMRGDGTVGAKGGWIGAFNVQNLPPHVFAARIGEWTNAVEGIGSELWRLFVGRLDAALQETGIKPGARIVWLPTSTLGLLPLGLARSEDGTTRFGDKYELVNAPSLEALARAIRQADQPPPPSLAAVVNPTGDLPFTEVEVDLIASHFTSQPKITLDRTSATPQAVLASLKGKSYWHFASHGAFDWSDARKSGLRLRDNAPLSIGELLDAEGSLGRPRLVVLSACETGLYDVARNPDEFVGLPATFMQLGATGVFATLWQVDDLATSLLMAKFYDLHLGQRMAPPAALRLAQIWLRNVRGDEARTYAKAAAAAAKLAPSRLVELEDQLAQRRGSASSRLAAIARSLQTRNADGSAGQLAESEKGGSPFSHPYYWGGFVYTGL